MGMESPRGKRLEMEMLREETEEAKRREAGKGETDFEKNYILYL